MVSVVPDPETAIVPGDLVNTQLPWAGKLFSTTLPVILSHEGWVMVPISGASGADGTVLITTCVEFSEEQLLPVVTAKV
jgi:hypothetical protein